MLLDHWLRRLSPRYRSVRRGVANSLRRFNKPTAKRRLRGQRAAAVELLETRVLLSGVDAADQVLVTETPAIDLALGDVTGDGLRDAVALTENGIVVGVSGDGTEWDAVATTPGSYVGLLVADFDGDLQDEVVAHRGNVVDLYQGDGDGRLTLTASWAADLAPLLDAVRHAELNGDGRIDLVAAAADGGLLVWTGRGDGTFDQAVSVTTGLSDVTAIAAGDVVGDPAPDLVAASSDGTVVVLEGDGRDFALRNDLSISVPGQPASIELFSGQTGDTGRQDVLVASGSDVYRISIGSSSLGPVVSNGTFDRGLSDWDRASVGAPAGRPSGRVELSGRSARLVEGESFLTTLSQSFDLPATASELRFDLVSLRLASGGGLPDAFEATLLAADGSPLLDAHRAGATSFFNVTDGDEVTLGDGVSFDGTTVRVDLTSVAGQSGVRLLLDLVGHPQDGAATSSSTVVIDNVSVDAGVVIDNVTVTPLSLGMSAAGDLAVGDIDGDGRTDLVVGDGSRVIQVADIGDRATVTTRDVPGGAGPVAIGDVTGDLVDDVTIGTGRGVLSPLAFDAVAPTVAMVDPLAGTTTSNAVDAIRLRFSEPMSRDGSSAVDAAGNYQVSGAGSDDTPGTADDELVAIVGVDYDDDTLVATLALASELADGSYRVVVGGEVADLAGNRLDGDGGGGTAAAFEFGVNRSGPVVSVTPPGDGIEGTELTLTASFTDPGGQTPFVANVDWGDGTTSVAAITAAASGGTLAASKTYRDDGVYEVVVTVTDASGVSGFETLSLLIENAAPTLSGPSVATVEEGRELTLPFTLSDPGQADRHDVTVDWGDGTPATMIAIDNGERAFDLTHAYAGDGTYTATVTLADRDGGEVVQAVAVTVSNVGPALDPLSLDTVDEGSELIIAVPFRDPAAGGETYSATVDWGDGSETIALVTPTGEGGLVRSRHIYADDGEYTVVVTVSDGADEVATSATAVVTNAAPEVSVSGDVTLTLGETLSRRLATFTDAGFGPTETFTAAIDWGDGQVDAAVPIVVDGEAGRLTVGDVAGSHTYAAVGSYTVTVTVTDDDGATKSATFTATVAPKPNGTPLFDAIEPVTGQEGGPVSITAGFSDDGDIPYVAIVDWGDGRTSSATVDFADGRGTVEADHVYADNGLYDVTITLRDADGAEATGGVLASIGNVAPTLTAADPITVYRGQSLDAVVARFTDPAFADEPLAATIDWGDGTVEAGFVSRTPGGPQTLTTGSIRGRHTFPTTGLKQVRVSLSDGIAEQTVELAVQVLATEPQLTVAPTVSGSEGEIVVLTASVDSPSAYRPSEVTVDWGNGQTDVVDISWGGAGDDATGLITATTTYGDEGAYLVTVAATNPLGETAAATTTATVAGQAPFVALRGVGSPIVGQPTTVRGTITDAGFDQPATTWGVNSQHSCGACAHASLGLGEQHSTRQSRSAVSQSGRPHSVA